MPTTISPAALAVYPGSISCPADGELANAASVNGAFQSVETGLDASRQLTFGRKLRPRYKVEVGTNTVNPKMTVEALGYFLVTKSGIWTAVPHPTATVVDLLTALGAANFTIKTRYYLYVGWNGTVITWLASTTVPSTDLMYMTGNTDWAFVGTFLANSVTNTTVDPCYEYGGVHMLAPDGGYAVVSGGTAAAQTAAAIYTTAAAGEIAPSYAHQLLVQVRGGSNAANDTLFLYGRAGGSASALQFPTQSTDSGLAVDRMLVSFDKTNLYYFWTTGGGTGLLLSLRGWIDPR